MPTKMRLDVYLVENGLTLSRTEAKGYITSGAVTVDGRVITKPAYDVTDAKVSVDTSSKKYVSRGGLKLEGALDNFGLSPEGKSAIDVGASSGGFTDCLLQRGARHVVAIDSGSGQLVEALRCDARVTVVENFNARNLSPEDIEYIPDFAVMDVSFISATLIIPRIYECLADNGDFVCLVKPQFEVGKSGLGKGGIVKSASLRENALARVCDFARDTGFSVLGTMLSPIEGGDGNIEYLVHFKKGETK
ncbi:MAG: TlyA family RNA methyltransferase [Clostridia bacterium]|nr:TlyA family RNA methyltransferase [Clostridia bacterium]